MSETNLSFTNAATVLVIADDATLGDEAADAVDLAGARLLARIGVAQAEDRMSLGVPPDVLAIECRGADEEALGALLHRVDALTRDGALGAVVAFDPEQIDLVTARMLGRHVELLCAPALPDRIAALALARTVPAYRAHDTSHDERTRLQMLNDEVARIADTLAKLTRSSGHRSAGLARDPGVAPEDVAPIAAATVRNTIRARRMRANVFRSELFADPAWDMLLDLFAADLERARVSVSSLCIAAAVPGTTALRWIGTMLEEDLFERSADPVDRRRAYISLSAKAREGMQRYFDALRRAGLASG